MNELIVKEDPLKKLNELVNELDKSFDEQVAYLKKKDKENDAESN